MGRLLAMLLATVESAPDKGWLEGLYSTLFDPHWNREHVGTIAAVILVVLVFTGVGLPTPEDIWLTLAGFTSFKLGNDRFVWYYFLVAFLSCSAAILVGDIGAWGLGRRYGFAIRDRFKFMRRMLTDKRILRVQGWFDNYGSWTVFLGRQVAGVRFVTFFSAGTMRMSLPKFLLFDFLGCLVSVPVWLTLGALAAIYGREWLDKASRYAGGSLLGVFAVVIVVFLIVVKIRSSRRARRDAATLAADTPLNPPATEKPAGQSPASP